MHRCAVIGSPVAHSLSPLIHRTAYAELGISTQFSYDRFEVVPEQLPGFMAGLGDEWVGLSVTAPDKEALLQFGEADSVASALSCGNTLIFGRGGEPNRIYNTDVTGMVLALNGIRVTNATTGLLVGNGATARSVLWAFHRLGIITAVVLARDADRATRSLASVAGPLGIELIIQPFGRPAELPADFGGRADLLVQTTPRPLPSEFAAALVDQAAVVFELVYNQYPSNLDRAAAAAGVPALDGLDQLVGQALDQIWLMTGRRARAAPLLAACRAELLDRRSRA